MTRMKIWITSDHHFFHGNIIKYCDRPFSNWEEMNNKMIELWNNKVSKNDLVIHLGDFSFGDKNKIVSVRNKLNGTIILVRGSHDWKIDSSMGFIIVEGRLLIHNLILTHEPLEKESIPEGFVNIHGHIHHRDSFNGINLSVEKTNFEPVELNSILKTK